MSRKRFKRYPAKNGGKGRPLIHPKNDVGTVVIKVYLGAGNTHRPCKGNAVRTIRLEGSSVLEVHEWLENSLF